MKRSKFTEEQITYALCQVESGTPVPDVCRQLGVSEATFYVWKKKYAHLGASELRRIRQLAEENPRLKHVVADLTLDNGRAYARRSRPSERRWPTRRRRHAAPTSPDARRPRRSFGWCRTICTACRRSTTTASRASTARGVPSLRRSPTSSSRAESSTTASRASALDACAHEYLLAFSCKCRYFCPSCHAKRLAIWAHPEMNPGSESPFVVELLCDS